MKIYETLVNCYLTTRHHISEVLFNSHRYEKLKYYKTGECFNYICRDKSLLPISLLVKASVSYQVFQQGLWYRSQM
jgi:hypothetical protein